MMVAVALALVGGYAVWAARDVALRWFALRFPVPEVPTGAIQVPDDIVAVAMCEGEEWAQESVLDTARQKYAALAQTQMGERQRWNMVRKSLGIGERDG